jgi:uncharacterized metal-binding protein
VCAEKYTQPLIYSCSGCSNVAQLANDLAVVMDREGHAQMSCIAGVGANVKGLVALAKSGRPIFAIDGCKIACVKKTLALRHVEPHWHLELTSLGFKKIEGESCSFNEMNKALHVVQNLLHSYDLVPAVELNTDELS